jgi:hypothetical protein
MKLHNLSAEQIAYTIAWFTFVILPLSYWIITKIHDTGYKKGWAKGYARGKSLSSERHFE